MFGALLGGLILSPFALVMSPAALLLLVFLVAAFVMKRQAHPGPHAVYCRRQFRVALLAFLYVLSYESISLLGKHESVEYEALPDRSMVWAASDGLRQGYDNAQVHGLFEYTFLVIYFPLIRIDRARGQTHFLDGGEQILARFG